MTKEKPTLTSIRKKMTSFQRRLVHEIWRHYLDTGDWPLLRVLYSTHGKSNVKVGLSSLGAQAGWEEGGPRRWSRYRLSLLGALLSADGPNLAKLMVRFFEFQRTLFQKEPAREEASSVEIEKTMSLTPAETVMLGHLVWLGSFGGGRGATTSTWSVSAMEEAADFPKVGDLSKEFDRWLFRFHEQDSSVFQEDRNQRFLQRHPVRSSQDVSTSPHPSEIALSIERLRERFPDPKKLGFLIMRFTGSKPFRQIVQAIKSTAALHNIVIIRADECQFHTDLWGNVRTLLHGCGFGIAVCDRIDTNEPNSNVGLEIGYLIAMNKPVLLLKDKTVPALQSDLAGKLYKPFDPHEPKTTIPEQLTTWLEDNGIIVRQHH